MICRYLYSFKYSYRMLIICKQLYSFCKIKESEKKDKYLDLARELRKLWNMRMTVVAVVIGALGTVPKGLERGLGKL